MPQISDVTANEKARYKSNELELFVDAFGTPNFNICFSHQECAK